MEVISDNFYDLLDDLYYQAQNQHKSLVNKAQTKAEFLEFSRHPWYPFPLDTLDISLLGEGVSNNGENNPNDMYVRAIKGVDKDGKKIKVTTADVMAIGMQGSYLAAIRRSYVLLHATPVRRRAWSAARFKGHGTTETGLFDRVYNQVITLINSAEMATDATKEGSDEEQLNAAMDLAQKQIDNYGFLMDF